MFFAGGRSAAGDDNSFTFTDSGIYHVRLTTKARRMLARLSDRRVARLQIAATAAIGTQRTTFTLGARR
jgi:hypothetical protein